MPHPDLKLPVAVLGGGITGLTAGWHLKQAGIPFVVFEASTRTGGAIQSVREDGWLREAGPNTLLESSSSISEFLDQIGLGQRKIFANRMAKKRYVVKGGTLVPLPLSPGAFFTSNLFSFQAKMRIFGEPFRSHSPGSDETLADFARRRFGQEFLDYAVNPFVAGVYAGDPEFLSLRHGFPKLQSLMDNHHSALIGAVRTRGASGGSGRILSFPNGLEEIPLALENKLGDAVRTGCAATRIEQGVSGWAVSYKDGAETQTELFSAIISALPQQVLSSIPIDGTQRQLTCLSEIQQPPVASVFTGHAAEDVPHSLDGFGLLIPEIEKRNTLGTLFSSVLFPGRAPAGQVALTTFVGGTRHPERAHLDDDALLSIVSEDHNRLLGIHRAPRFVRIARWSKAIPQYTMDFGRFKAACSDFEQHAPGFFIGGNCRDGISIPQCIESGKRLAKAAADHIGAT